MQELCIVHSWLLGTTARIIITLGNHKLTRIKYTHTHIFPLVTGRSYGRISDATSIVNEILGIRIISVSIRIRSSY